VKSTSAVLTGHLHKGRAIKAQDSAARASVVVGDSVLPLMQHIVCTHSLSRGRARCCPVATRIAGVSRRIHEGAGVSLDIAAPNAPWFR
jgi:hypothetical protein